MDTFGGLVATLAPLLSLTGVAIASYNYWSVLKYPEGTERMKWHARPIHDGVMTFLRQEYQAIAVFVVVMFVVLTVAFWQKASLIAVAYVFGASCSLLAGYLGTKSCTRSGVRTTEAARQSRMGAVLVVAFTGGSVMGLSVAALAMLGFGVVMWLGQGLDFPALV